MVQEHTQNVGRILKVWVRSLLLSIRARTSMATSGRVQQQVAEKHALRTSKTNRKCIDVHECKLRWKAGAKRTLLTQSWARNGSIRSLACLLFGHVALVPGVAYGLRAPGTCAVPQVAPVVPHTGPCALGHDMA
jgi:hypothetical protein